MRGVQEKPWSVPPRSPRAMPQTAESGVQPQIRPERRTSLCTVWSCSRGFFAALVRCLGQ